MLKFWQNFFDFHRVIRICEKSRRGNRTSGRRKKNKGKVKGRRKR